MKAVRRGAGGFSWDVYATAFAVALSLLIIVVKVAGDWPVKLVNGVNGESGFTPGALDFQGIVATALACSIVLYLVPSMIAGEGYGVRLPVGPHRVLKFIRAAALSWLAMSVAGAANPWLRHGLGLPQWGGGVSASVPISDGEMFWLAVFAGFTEEVVGVAVPVGAVFCLVVLSMMARSRLQTAVGDARDLWRVAIVVGGGFGVVDRGIGHLYQGHVSAVMAILWGAALLWIFHRYRSIWPLMIGHFVYDIPFHTDSWTVLYAYALGAPVLVVLGTHLVGRMRVPRRQSV